MPILDITQDPVAICQYEYQPCNVNSSVVNSINTKFVLCLCCDGITPLEYTGAPCVGIDVTITVSFSIRCSTATIYFAVSFAQLLFKGSY